jgi:hypothetical protein
MARACAARGDIDGGRAAVAELAAIAAAVKSDLLQAALSFASGVVGAAGNAPEPGRGLLEDAADRFERGGLPFEAAEARSALAEVLRALGQQRAADREARLRRAGFRAARRDRVLLDGPRPPQRLAG